MEIAHTVKLHIKPANKADAVLLISLSKKYAEACNFISDYVFANNFILNFMKLQEDIYKTVREKFGLKSQFTISALKTVTARYKTIQEQLKQNPYKYKNEETDKWEKISKTLEWLWEPITFSRPQADFVRGRDYSFVNSTKDGKEIKLLSLNTLEKRIRVEFDMPKAFEEYFDGSWKLGGGKLVCLNGEWYFHIAMTKEVQKFSFDSLKHVVGIDRGLRFLATSYDEQGQVKFFDGKAISKKRNSFLAVRAELQSKGTKSAKRVLKRISERENRWITDVNHQISKTLVEKYGPHTLFVFEDLTGINFAEELLSHRTKEARYQLRSWPFYQLEQFLTYKAEAIESKVVEVSPKYTSQRCPKCGRIRKANRHHDIHEYKCDCCGYRSNDDRTAAMNIQFLGTLYVSGDTNPRFGVRKSK